MKKMRQRQRFSKKILKNFSLFYLVDYQ